MVEFLGLVPWVCGEPVLGVEAGGRIWNIYTGGTLREITFHPGLEQSVSLAVGFDEEVLQLKFSGVNEIEFEFNSSTMPYELEYEYLQTIIFYPWFGREDRPFFTLVFQVLAINFQAHTVSAKIIPIDDLSS